jgi:Ca2+-binding EF-hand superfamily protein
MSALPKPRSGATRLAAGATLLALGTLVAASPTAQSFDDPKNAAPPGHAENAAETVDLICLASKRPIVIRLHTSVDGQSIAEFQTAIARRLFDTLDADKNGLLEGKELASLPTPQMVAGAGRESGTLPNAAASIAPLAPEKGKVTPDAFARFLFPRSATPLTLASPARSEPTMNGPVREMAAGREGGELSALLSAIDANGDRRLSAAELSRADDLFRLFDVNDDEQISRAELDTLLALGTTFNFSQGESPKLAVPLEPLPRTSDKTALVRSLIESFGARSKPGEQPVGKGDKGKPPKKPPGIPAECIVGADKNGDGWLDESELASWLAHPQPQRELSVELIASSLQEPRVKLLSLPSVGKTALSVETPSPGKLVLRVDAVPLELRAAEPSRRVVRTSRYRALFKRADQNQNGYLEKSEIPYLGQGLGSVDFEAMDRDHNGMVFEDEWLAYLRLRDTFSDGRLSLTMASEFIDPIAEFDTNHDGRLNRAEFGRLLAAIAAWDRNHDGFVTPDEVPKTLVGTFHLGPLRAAVARNPRYSRMKSPQPSQPPSEGPVWFQKMDRDHDGEVSLREFLGPLSVFRRLDTNGDGRLDVHEAQAAQK